MTLTPLQIAHEYHMLKIGHLFQAPGIQFSDPQAAQLHIYHTIRGLQQVGHEVNLLALQRGRRALFTDDLSVFRAGTTLRNGHYGRLGVSGTPLFKAFESGSRRVQKELNLPYLALFDSYRLYDACRQNLRGYDILHERYNLLALGGALASRKLGIPLVLEVNADLLEQREFKGRPEKGLRRWFAEWSTQFCFNTAAKIVCVSSELRDHLHDKWTIDGSKLAVLPCAADVERFGQTNNAVRTRHNLGLTTEPVVMWVGGFYHWHDLELLVDSFERVVRVIPNAKLVLVGSGETQTQLEHKVQKKQLEDAVIMTGMIPHEQIPNMLSIAQVAVAPSPPLPARNGGTGTPLKLFEYMAAGKAIVATAASQATAVIQHEHTGLLVEPGNVQAFADALIRLLCAPEERERLSQNARTYAVERHSWKQYTMELEVIYRSVL